MRVEISKKVAKEVFMGDFKNLPLEYTNLDSENLINKELLNIRHSKPDIIREEDFDGLKFMRVILKESEYDHFYKRKQFEVFALVNIDGCWFVSLFKDSSSIGIGTSYTFTKEQIDIIGERVKNNQTIISKQKDIKISE